MAQVNAGRVRFVSRGEYNNSTQYYLFDLVNYNGNSYFAKENTTGNLPTDTTKWQLIAEKGNKGDVGNVGPQGFSPIATVTQTSTGATISITDNNGTTTADISNGEVTQAQLDETNRAVDYYKSTLNALPKVEGEGTELTLDNTAEAPMKMSLGANMEQASATGKNKFDKTKGTFNMAFQAGLDGDYASDNWNITDYIPVEYGKTYYISDSVSQHTVRYYDENKIAIDYFSRRHLLNNLTQNTKYIRFDYKKAVIDSVMFSENSEETPYEPYTGGIASPNPDYPQDIHTISGDNEIVLQNKNLLPSIINWEKGDISTAGGGTDTSGENYIRTKGLHKCKPNTNYYFTYDGNYKYSIYFFDNDKTFLGRLGNTQQALPRNFTTPENCYYYRIALRNEPSSTSIKTDEILTNKFQLELGTVATSYAEHQEQSLPLNLPVENLFDKDNATYKNNYYKNDSGVETSSQLSGYLTSYISVIPNTKYTINGQLTGGDNSFAIYYYDDSQQWISRVSSLKITPYTFITPSNCYFIQFQYTKNYYDADTIQINKGNPTSVFYPYGTTPLEYCKIGDYEDEFYLATESDTSLVAGKWYLKKNVGKVVIKDLNIYTYNSTIYGAYFYIRPPKMVLSASMLYCRIYKKVRTTPSTWVNGTMVTDGMNVQIIDNRYSSKEEFKEGVGGEYLYYPLSTPEYILLNDTLQSQLTEIYKWVKAYQDQTNISQVNNDLPFVIKASAVRDMSNIFELIGGGE